MICTPRDGMWGFEDVQGCEAGSVGVLSGSRGSCLALLLFFSAVSGPRPSRQ